MVVPSAWGIAAAVFAPVVLLRGVTSKGKKRSAEGRMRNKDDDGADPSFVCERVCTSDRLLRRLGGLAKDVTPQSCVTVCGVSRADSCTESCQRVVCMNMHQVPAWNDQCLKRCTTECQKGRAT
ncbi:hypothetical protein HOP50_02g13450 [Chloropicon primus]|uniref:Uncharacterized protein n=1 Tax=Chloropicon primus TaxID=1764295 RepID=A0A5B8MHK0_9CHLO|nr:hypothetical protein A3770_02p13580 [Chloropicon primus]UPQ98047.1 hypothetical protein HOP50_02g13450 [Chloropicon primus]|mmetsp:Transcript_31456/g.67948  ORF Transcript_31456/g.67948 Transcript_31456/m.67948 type:complete len:124 (+) Transcript_31456:176-547(+)|eukprot:QDZ18840.1 hypothetical protein A3770_02p13580 [Chloropicon primus]